MKKWEISFIIGGLDLIEQKSFDGVNIDGVKFQNSTYDEIVGTIILESHNTADAIEESKYFINKALAKFCFASGMEAYTDLFKYYIADLTNDSEKEKPQWKFGGSFPEEQSRVPRKDTGFTLTKIKSLKSEKEPTLDLALAYYQLGQYKNPLRIESFFSSMTVLIRDLWTKELPKKDEVTTAFLKEKIKLILKDRNPTIFHESEFYNQWKEYYVDERCSIAHGRGSKIIDPRTIHEYDYMTRNINSWNRDVIYYYVDNFQNSK